MRYGFKRSFDRSYQSLTASQQKLIDECLRDLKGFYEGHRSLQQGLGLKKIGKDYWEVRAGLSIRVIFQHSPVGIVFFFVGDHNQIRRFISA